MFSEDVIRSKIRDPNISALHYVAFIKFTLSFAVE